MDVPMLVYVRHLLQEPKRLRLWQAPSVERFGPAITSFEDPEVELIPIWSKDNSEVARAHPLTPETEVKSDPLITPQVILDESLPGKDWRPLDIQLRTFLRISQDLSKRFLTD